MSLPELSQEQLEQESYTKADSPLERREKQRNMLSKLSERPCTLMELASSIKNGKTLALRYLNELIDAELVERIPRSYYYQRTNWQYHYDLENDPIAKIPEIFFRDIPIIKRWWQWSIGNPSRLANINTFQNICYGRVVEKFKINPSKWVHKETTERFYLLYKEQYKDEMPDHIKKAIRAFLSICHDVVFQKNSHEAKFLGLNMTSQPGQYKYIKLRSEELDSAIAFLEGDEGKELAQKEGLGHDALLAHFAYALEGFPRPSRVLTIEVDRVEKYRDKSNNLILHWLQIETKQSDYFPKFMMDPRLTKHAVAWLEKRRALNYRYLFIDDNSYQVEPYDTHLLAGEREPFAAIYKKMFERLGKKEVYYYSDTLYTLRHCGVHLWLDRLGYAGLVLIKEMGWENMQTLLDHYSGIPAKDMLQYILQSDKAIAIFNPLSVNGSEI